MADGKMIFIVHIKEQNFNKAITLLFHGRGLYHIESSPLICSVNKWFGFYIIGTSVIKEIKI